MTQVTNLRGIFTGLSPHQAHKLYRQKAMELHPDRGGDPVAMAELNQAWARYNGKDHQLYKPQGMTVTTLTLENLHLIARFPYGEIVVTDRARERMEDVRGFYENKIISLLWPHLRNLIRGREYASGAIVCSKQTLDNDWWDTDRHKNGEHYPPKDWVFDIPFFVITSPTTKKTTILLTGERKLKKEILASEVERAGKQD